MLERSDAYWSTYSQTGRDVVALTSTFTESGMTFTHRATADDVSAESRDEGPDLSVVLWDSRRGLPLDDDSGRVEADYSAMARPRLSGPPD